MLIDGYVVDGFDKGFVADVLPDHRDGRPMRQPQGRDIRRYLGRGMNAR